jgi:urea carboxylase-associated protein 2
MGRVLCSITEDTCGWHDTLCGATDARLTAAKYGIAEYQEKRNDWYRNGRDNFLVELGKHGLGRKDLPVPINFFSKVTVGNDGSLKWRSGNSKPGAAVQLRAEMNVLVILSNTPHPLEPSAVYAPKPVGIQVGHVPAPTADDPCRLSRPENGRGFINTERLFR